MANAYIKDNSFHSLNIDQKARVEGLRKVMDMYESIENYTLPKNKIVIIKKACEDILKHDKDEKNCEPRFVLYDHVAEEINRLSTSELARYIYYRYRYDMYPKLKIVDEFPPCVQIEPTSICNYRCVFCYQTDSTFNKKSQGHMGHMTIETYRNIIDQIEGEVEAVTLASRGEPLLCPDIKEILDYTRGKFLGFKINTNAWLLDEGMSHSILSSGVNTIVFSADAANEEDYKKYRVGGELKKVLSNIERFMEIKDKHYSDSKVITRVSGVRVDETQDINEMEALWGGYVDQVAFVKYNPWENVYVNNPTNINEPCTDLWRRMFVWHDGKTNPCDVDYKSYLSVGGVSSNMIKELWNGDKYNNLRSSHLSVNRDEVDPCSRCTVV